MANLNLYFWPERDTNKPARDEMCTVLITDLRIMASKDYSLPPWLP